MKSRFGHGFTLIELMIVIAIIAFLAMIAIPNYLRFVAKSKRAEVYLNLGSLYTAEKAYWAEHGTYTDNLTALGWKPEGEVQYTYGFTGGGCVQGKLKAPCSALAGTRADKDGFVAAAAGDIDGDGALDVITIDDKHSIKILQDDLA